MVVFAETRRKALIRLIAEAAVGGRMSLPGADDDVVGARSMARENRHRKRFVVFFYC